MAPCSPSAGSMRCPAPIRWSRPISTGTNSGNVHVVLGNGDGTFQPPQDFVAMAPRPGDNVGVHGLAVVDFGSPVDPGKPDGHLDIIVTAQSRSGVGPAEVIMLPGLV